MSRINPAIMLCMAGILLSCGCASVRVRTDLIPGSDASLQSPAGKFYIAGLKYSNSHATTGQDSASQATFDKRLLGLVRGECASRYPLLFSNGQGGAVCLWLNVDDGTVAKNQGGTAALMLCSLLVVGGILPMPLAETGDIAVETGPWNGAAGIANTPIQAKLHRENRAWGSVFTPLALIPVPGKSDLPKQSFVALNGAPNYPVVWIGFDFFPQIAQQIATVVAKQVTSQDPAYWEAQPRWTPSATGPSAAQPAPVALPTPTETVAPF